MSHYGTLVEANQFFGGRLFTEDWDMASVENRVGAMNQATELIDQFDYIGRKYAVQLLYTAAGDECPDAEEVQLAELSQEHEFPRGTDDTVPVEIEQACYLIAQAILSGRSPDMDMEGLAISNASYGGVRATFDRSEIMEHLTHLIPSPEAFNLLRPFFRSRNQFNFRRV